MRLANTNNINVEFDITQFVADLRSCRPHGSSGAYAFKWDYLLANVVRKYPLATETTDSERKQRAINKMLECEEKCFNINRSGLPHSAGGIVYLARKIILAFLGTEPDLQLFDRSAFSGGATTSRKRKHGNPIYKYIGSNSKGFLDVTQRAYPYAKAYIGLTPLWCENGGYERLRVVPGNTVTTVPKDNEIDRPIAKEPDMNMLLQKAVGSEIRARLSRGISYKWFNGKRLNFSADLNDQSRNRDLAREGSITNQLATLDLSSASDLISHLVVFELLPPKWYKLLFDLRCDFGICDGKLVPWSKFSAMGCGFTFELESLIFFAIAIANAYQANIEEPKLSIYGDDIICNSQMANRLSESLSQFGFEVNQQKSFSDGPFRESCGGHYFNGYDVSPFYLKKEINTPERLCHLLNRLRGWAGDDATGMCDPSVYDLWCSIINTNTYLKKVRGGSNLERTDYIVSPSSSQKMRIVGRTVSTVVSGWRAFLAKYQSQHYSYHGNASNSITLDKFGRIRKSFIDSHTIDIDSALTFFTLSKNEEPSTNFGESVKPFPQEVAFLIENQKR